MVYLVDKRECVKDLFVVIEPQPISIVLNAKYGVVVLSFPSPKAGFRIFVL